MEVQRFEEIKQAQIEENQQLSERNQSLAAEVLETVGHGQEQRMPCANPGWFEPASTGSVRHMDGEQFRKMFLLLLVVAISALFLQMIHSFLLTILLAAIFSALLSPVYHQLERLFRGR